MTDRTSRDVRLGDLSTVEVASVSPRASADAVDASPTRPRRAEWPGAADPRRASGDAGGETSWAVILLGGTVLVLLGIVVFLVMQQRDLAKGLDRLDNAAKQSVAELETRVASTNTTLRSSDAVTQRSLDVIVSDISKINAAQNKLAQALEQEAKARVLVEADLKKAAADIQRVAQVAAQATALVETKHDTRLKAVSETLDQLGARSKSQGDAITRLEKSGDAAQLRSEVAVLGASVRQLQDDHERRLKQVEQSSASTDAFRRQVNAGLDRLNQQVNELNQRK